MCNKPNESEIIYPLIEQTSNKLHLLLICVVLVLATIIAYEPVRHNDFVDYDDVSYVTKNPRVNSGITLESAVFFFTNSHCGMWHPLTSWSFMLDCQLFGLNPFWHHLTSLLFHIANTLLLFWVLIRMTGALWPSALVAAAFALHPLNVESVAWLAERKTVLSGFFCLLTIAVYIRYSERPAIGRYLLVFLVYGLCIMTKPVVVTLPFILLLLDYWPLRRFRWGFQNEAKDLPQHEPVGLSCQESSAWRLVGEKVPLFILAGVLSIITFVTQQRVGSVVPIEIWPLNLRIANAPVSYISYIGKMIYPSRLAVLYPLPFDGLPLWQLIVSLLILAAVSAGVIYTARQRRYLVVGWLWYLGTLVPVIGLVQSGDQAMADRYFYLPGVGIFIMLAWSAAALFAKWRFSKIEVGASFGLVLAILLMCTRTQVRYWRNNFALYGHALGVTKNNYKMRGLYGLALLEDGQPEKAIPHFRQALQMRPEYYDAREYMGMALLDIGKDLTQEGKSDEAIKYFTSAIQIDPKNAESHNSIGAELIKVNKINEAIEEFHEALRLEPNYSEAYNNLGVAWAAKAEFEQAIVHYDKALSIEPGNAEIHNNLGSALVQQGKIDQAIEHFREALKLEPENYNAHNNMAVMLFKKNRIDEAIVHWTEALRLKPDWAEVRSNLNKLIKRNKQEENIARYSEMLRRNPDDPNTHQALATELYRQGKIDEAIAHWLEAAKQKPDWAEVQNSLGTAFYQQSKPKDAVKYWSEAIRLKPDWPEPQNNLAWLLATAEDEKLHNPAEAVRLAERACELSDYNQPGMLDTLGVTYAAAGRFTEAVKTAEKGIELAQQTKQETLAEDIQNRLELYRMNKPYRD